MIKSTTLTTALLFSIAATSQITIISADMPDAGDSIRVSLTNSIGSNNAMTTGANHTWNYSSLNPTAQRKEFFQAPSNFVSPYNLLFNVLNTSYGKDNYGITSLPIPGVQITAAYDFFKESSTELKQLGAGYVVNSAPIPFLYTSPDVIYKFPMNYLNVDSCTYKFGLPIPTIGYYGQTAKRINTVDGWGTLTTPYGTFQTLRVKSAITATDTIFLTTLGFGAKIPRPLKYEFKWLAIGQKVPVLQIDANSINGNLVVSTVVYRDSLRNAPQVGINEEVTNENYNVQIFPNPAVNKAFISYELSTETDVNIQLVDVLGKIVFSEKYKKQSGICFKEFSVDEFSKGIYFVNVQMNNTVVTKKLIVQ